MDEVAEQPAAPGAGPSARAGTVDSVTDAARTGVAGTSRAEPDGAARRATRRVPRALVGAAFLAAAMALGATVVFDADGGSAAPTSDDGGDDAVPTGAEVGTVADAEVLGGGVSTFTTPDGADAATYAVVLRNTGDLPLVDVRASVDLLDAAGDVVLRLDHVIGVAPAGHRVAIGDVVYDPAVVDVVDLDVSLHDPSVPRPAPPPGELTTDDVETTTDEADTRVTFTVSSTFGERVDGAVATAVLRDEEGAIIGGAMTVLGPVPTEGQARARIDAFSPVPGVDPDGTTVTVTLR